MNKLVIIVGAGISGLYSAFLLAKNGFAVRVLEASERVGGRIYTMNGSPFNETVELGAEFVHGNLQTTLSLLDNAGIGYSKISGDGISSFNGKLKKNESFIADWDLFEERVEQLDQDITVDDFLEKEFSDNKFNELKESVRKYASGFDTADSSKASMLSLKNEWLHEQDDQYRVEGGYQKLLNFLEKQLINMGVEIMLNHGVKSISIENNEVLVSANGNNLTAYKVIVTISLGVLKAGKIKFDNNFNLHISAIQKMGFGAIIKVLLKFNTPFWEDLQDGIAKNMGFLFSSQVIPTWWTQMPERLNILTGWLGGSAAEKLKDASDEEIMEMSIKSLSAISSIPFEDLKQMLSAWKVANWTNDPYVLGSYSYPTVDNENHIRQLLEPVGDQVFFAGEALYNGPATGTVEAALVSAQNAVDRLATIHS